MRKGLKDAIEKFTCDLLLSNNIYIERRNGYSLRGGDCLSVPRFETRFMTVAYRGTVLWNTICLDENGVSHMSNKDRSVTRTKDHFKDFKFDTSTASTMRHRNADFTYNRPFYRYGGHLEFRGNYGMPRGQMRNN